MEIILYDCREFVAIYLDDVIVFSNSDSQHAEHVACVLRLFNQYHLRLNVDKCKIGFRRVKYLGHLVGDGKASIDPSKLIELQQHARPNTPKATARFLGIMGFVAQYVPLFSQVVAPLRRLAGNGHSNKPFHRDDWGATEETAFVTILKLLTANVVLHTPVPGIPLEVACDASKYGMGATLSQMVNGERQLIDVASRGFNKASAEISYGACKRELAAVTFALKKFQYLLDGQKFILLTDHQALTYLATKDKPSQTILNWLHLLGQFNCTIRHLPGVLNTLPDYLSRIYEPIQQRVGRQLTQTPRVAEEMTWEPSTEMPAGMVTRYWKARRLAEELQQQARRRDVRAENKERRRLKKVQAASARAEKAALKEQQRIEEDAAAAEQAEARAEQGMRPARQKRSQRRFDGYHMDEDLQELGWGS